jgi:hypothetical protein
MARANNRTFSLVTLGVGACCALIGGWSAEVVAQEASTSDTTEDAAYRAIVKDALAEYDAHHYEEARSLFRRAHQINPNARTLRGIGMASFDLRDYVAAVRALSASLAETRKPLTPEQRAHAQGLLERSRSFIDVYTLRVTPADARILIDGRPPDFEPDRTVLLSFGAHNLEASRAGYLLRAFPINARGGERKDLVVALESKAPTRAGAPVASVPQAEVPSATVRSPASHSRTAWLVAAGVAGVLAASAGAYWIFENGQLNSCRNPASERLRCNNEAAIKTDWTIAGGATLVTGAAALTFAVIGILSGPSSSPAPAARGSVSCGIVPAGILCSTSF